MTEDEMNIAIAKACGWKRLKQPTFTGTCLCVWRGPDGFERVDFPRYTRDLNACAEMEATLTDEQWRNYSIELATICGVTWVVDSLRPSGVRAMTTATALKRAKAFIKNFGLKPRPLGRI